MPLKVVLIAIATLYIQLPSTNQQELSAPKLTLSLNGSSSNTNCTSPCDVNTYKNWTHEMKQKDYEKNKGVRIMNSRADQTVKMRDVFSLMHFLSRQLSETLQCQFQNSIFDHFYELAIEVKNENPDNTEVNIKKLLEGFSKYYNISIFTKQEEPDTIRSTKYQCSRLADCKANKYDIIYHLVPENPELEKELEELDKFENIIGIFYYNLHKFFLFAREVAIMFPINRQKQMERSIRYFMSILLEEENMTLTYDEKVFPNNSENCYGALFPATGGYLKAVEHLVIKKNLLIKFEIKPRSMSGVLMLLHADEHFIALQMINGSIKLSANAGNGPFYAFFRPRNTKYFLDGCWHTILVLKCGDAIILKVDEQDLQFCGNPTNFGVMYFNPSLYIGGYPPELANVGIEETNEQFTGRVKNLQIDTKKYNISSFMTFGNVTQYPCPHI